MRIGQVFQWEKISGEPVVVENVRVTPQARVLALRLPFGAFVWNRPVSVVVERGAARESITVPDITLMSRVLLALLVIVFPILISMQRKGVKR